MPKDRVGNDIKAGDRIFWNNLLAKVKEVHEGGLNLGLPKTMLPPGASQAIMGGRLVLELEISFNPMEPMIPQMAVVKEPDNTPSDN